jgi:hypothetical protein
VVMVRWWLVDVLLGVVRWVCPGRRGGVWQIVEVPRRLSRLEAEELAAQVRNL